MHAFVFRGEAAEVRWGYHRAASLASWEMSPTADGATVTATTIAADAFRLSQPALTFVVARPKGTWVWPVLTLQQAGRSLTATLGPPQD